MANKLPDHHIVYELLDAFAERHRSMPDPLDERLATCRCTDRVADRSYFGEQMCARCRRPIRG